jgi:ABC-type glycerol-3-phosphate transport system permease component
MSATTHDLDRSAAMERIAAKRPKSGLSKTLIYLVLIILGAGSILPLLWMFSTSLKQTQTLYNFPPQFFPEHPTFSNYTDLFHRGAWGFI